MKPNESMSKVINGKRYSVKTATLLADNCYWDGSNFERNGHNTFLYRTKGGAYFRVDLTQWQGERDTLEAISREDAMELYEQLPEKEIEYEEAFDAVVEEATLGRPTYYDEPMKQTAIWLPDTMLEWLKSHPGKTMSEVMRDLINEKMKTAQ